MRALKHTTKTNRTFKRRHALLLALLILIAAPFVMWRLTVHQTLDIVVVNKTFPLQTDSEGNVTSLNYSKQRGLFWLLNAMGIENPDTGRAYDVRREYYGNSLADGQLQNRPLQGLEKVPDVIYLSDMYGTGNSKARGTELTGISGMTKEEVGVVASSYARGATIIGEYNIAGDPTKANVAKELEGIFGLRFTGLAGKFFSDLSSTVDVPDWIRATYEQQYGKKWTLEGGGIVIAGNSRILVLQRNVDFIGSSLQIGMRDDLVDAYGTKRVDYYNWFEIVESNDPESVIAWYDLELSDKGADQLKSFGLEAKFPAIIAIHTDKQHAYYMAGDFTDYRGPDRINKFIGAATLYRYFSVKSEGDLSYFYWQFYVPFMTKVLQDVEPLDDSVGFGAETGAAADGTKLVSKVTEGQFAIYGNGKWNKLYVQGVDIGAGLPGGATPDDPAFYADWFEKIAAMHANTLRVYALMPPAFYRALDTHNYTHPEDRLFVLQSIAIMPPADGNFASAEYEATLRQAVEGTINAIHGRGNEAATEPANAEVNGSSNDASGVKSGMESDSRTAVSALASGTVPDTAIYQSDVSGYVLGYLIDPNLQQADTAKLDSSGAPSNYTGEYVSAVTGSTCTEVWLASLLDRVHAYEQKSYGMQHPAGVVSRPALDRMYHDKFDPAGSKVGAVVDMNHIEASGKLAGGLFSAYDILPNQPGLLEGGSSQAKLSYDGYRTYLDAVTKQEAKHPVLISGIGLPTSGGFTEAEQGEGLVSLLSLVKANGAMGGLVHEWTDQWGASSPLSSALMVPYNRSNLWHNKAEPAQNYGIIALDPPIPTAYSMTLRGADPLKTLALEADESYLYMRADFSKLPDFATNTIRLYLDTVDRGNGEYMFVPEVTENWSGVEFEIRIEGSDRAELRVIPTYNASKGYYYTAVTTNGLFERIERQLSPAYVTRSGAKVQALQQDASTLTAGPFHNGDNHFYIQDNTVQVRIPWSKLNISDPSSLLVLSDATHQGLTEQKDTLSVRLTEGVVPSLVVMNKGTNKVQYHFPESPTSSGYKTFRWHTWDVPQYEQRAKSSYDRLAQAWGQGAGSNG